MGSPDCRTPAQVRQGVAAGFVSKSWLCHSTGTCLASSGSPENRHVANHLTATVRADYLEAKVFNVEVVGGAWSHYGERKTAPCVFQEAAVRVRWSTFTRTYERGTRFPGPLDGRLL